MAAALKETKDCMGSFKACVGTGIHIWVKLRNRCFNSMKPEFKQSDKKTELTTVWYLETIY